MGGGHLPVFPYKTYLGTGGSSINVDMHRHKNNTSHKIILSLLVISMTGCFGCQFPMKITRCKTDVLNVVFTDWFRQKNPGHMVAKNCKSSYVIRILKSDLPDEVSPTVPGMRIILVDTEEQLFKDNEANDHRVRIENVTVGIDNSQVDFFVWSCGYHKASTVRYRLKRKKGVWEIVSCVGGM